MRLGDAAALFPGWLPSVHALVSPAGGLGLWTGAVVAAASVAAVAALLFHP